MKYKYKNNYKGKNQYMTPMAFQKYEKKPRFVGLQLGIISGIIIQLLMNNLYLMLIKPMAVAISFSYLFYEFYYKPRIYNGTLTSYCRRTYEKPILNRMLALKAISSIMVGILFTDVVATTFFVFREGVSVINLNGVIHPLVTPLMLLFFAFIVYTIHFKEKYITLREYSNEMLFRMRESKMEYWQAIDDLTKVYDKKHGISVHGDYIYDYETSESKKDVKSDKEEDKTDDTTRRSPRVDKKEA